MLEKIETNMFPPDTDEIHYEEARTKYIANYKDFMRDKVDPIVGEAKWNEKYPEGYQTWRGLQRELNAYGVQEIIDTINKMIDIINNRIV